MLLASGRTTRDAAGALFLSPGSPAAVGLQERRDASSRVPHGCRVAGVERCIDGFGEHDDGPVGLDIGGHLRALEQDPLSLVDRTQPGGDVAAQVLDRHGNVGRRRVATRSVEQFDGPCRQSTQPGGVRSGVQQRAPSPAVVGECSGALVRL